MLCNEWINSLPLGLQPASYLYEILAIRVLSRRSFNNVKIPHYELSHFLMDLHLSL